MAKLIVFGTGGIRAPRQVELAIQLRAAGHHVICINSTKSYFFLSVYFLTRPRQFLMFLLMHRSAMLEFASYFLSFLGFVEHVKIARTVDLILIAPATCNTIAKIANGITDTYPLLIVRAFEHGKKVLIAPSMNPEMWSDPANIENVRMLTATEKYQFIGPVYGKTVTGEPGLGIMASNEEIMRSIEQALLADREIISKLSPAN